MKLIWFRLCVAWRHMPGWLYVLLWTTGGMMLVTVVLLCVELLTRGKGCG